MRIETRREKYLRTCLFAPFLSVLFLSRPSALAQDGLALLYEQSTPPNSVEGFVACCAGAVGYADYHLADDFLVPNDEWELSHVMLWGERSPAGGATEASIYQDDNGAPGILVATTGPATDYDSWPVEHWYGTISAHLIPLQEPVVLGEGRYWLVVRTLYAPFLDQAESADVFSWVGRSRFSGSRVLARENDDGPWIESSLPGDMVFSLYGAGCPLSPVRWVTAANGFFNHPANWTGEDVPGEEDTPVFSVGGEPFTISMSGDVANEALQVDGSEVRFGSALFTHTLRGVSACDPVLHVGPTPGSRLDLKDGNMVVHGDVLVEGSSSSLHLTNAQLTANERMRVSGGQDFAGVTVWESGSLDARAGITLAPLPASRGRLTVRSGGFAAIGGTLSSIGAAGRGELAVEAGGEAVAGSLILAGEAPGSTGLLTVSGVDARMTFADGLILGYEGLGRMEVAEGGRPTAQVVRLGFTPTAQGTLKLSGTQTRWPDVESLDLGVAGHGRVEVAEGAVLGAIRAFLGKESGGIGELIVNSGATFSSVLVEAGLAGAGIIDVSGGGSFEANVLRHGPNLTMELGPIPMQIGRMDRAGKRTSHHFQVDSLIAAGDDVVISAAAVEFGEGAYLGGTGTFAFDITNAGVVAPGDSVDTTGEFVAGGAYVQTGEGVLELELSDGDYDRLAVNGTATLAGTIRLRLTDGFAPQVGRSFQVVSAAAIQGAFERVELPEGLSVELSYAPTSVTATIAAPVAAEGPGEVPHGYALAQNYPNPFNPSTRIVYALPEQTHVRLLVYDAAGRMVRVLVDGVRPAGRHEATFSAEDLSSGLYLYRMETPKATIVRHMTLIR